MPPRHEALDTIDGAPIRFASGAVPQPPCPCCGHIRSVRPLAEVAPPPRRDPYGWFGNFIPAGRSRDPELRRSAPVPASRRAVARTLRPPRRPWATGQVIDRRLTVVIDIAFLGVALFLFGRLSRAAEVVDVAVALGVLAIALVIWLVAALATGRLRRLDARAQGRNDRAMRRWRVLLYCEDCVHVFRADGPGYLAPQAVPAYLGREGADAILRAARRY